MALAALRSGSNGRKTKESGSAAPTLQSLKSGQTRARLIEATIRCIVKSGYSNTTTPQIANAAGLSRGAMLHHFENGMALIKRSEEHTSELQSILRHSYAVYCLQTDTTNTNTQQ